MPRAAPAGCGDRRSHRPHDLHGIFFWKSETDAEGSLIPSKRLHSQNWAKLKLGIWELTPVSRVPGTPAASLCVGRKLGSEAALGLEPRPCDVGSRCLTKYLLLTLSINGKFSKYVGSTEVEC